MSTTPPLIIGSILTVLGFLKWPKGGMELMRPRFVIPILIWISLYAQFILKSENWEQYRKYHIAGDGEAMWFGVYCLALFWIGFVLPFGTWMTKSFSNMPRGVRLEPERLRTLALLACAIPFFVQLGLAGTTIFYASEFQFETRQFWLPKRLGQMVAVAIDLIAVVGVVLIGFSWPAKGKRTSFVMLVNFIAMFMVVHVFICRFSRAGGVAIMLAYAAASIRFRHVRIGLGIILFLLTMLLAHTGMTGRPIYGHFAGSYFFIKHMLEYSIWHPIEVLQVGLRAGDSLTPLAVVITGVKSIDINALAPLKWIIYQSPVPRFIGLPEWTADGAIIVGGHWRNPFWFTLSMYGDLYAHFGKLGAIGFMWVGIVYKFVDQLVMKFGRSQEEQITERYYPQLLSHGHATGQFSQVNFYLLYLIVSYAALNRGIFNSFRAWWIMFMYMTYAMLIVQFTLKMISDRQR